MKKAEQSEEGKDLKIKDMLSQSRVVEQLIELLDKYVTMVKKCFKNDTLFERSR